MDRTNDDGLGVAFDILGCFCTAVVYALAGLGFLALMGLATWIGLRVAGG